MFLEKIENSFKNSPLTVPYDQIDFILCLKHLNYLNSENTIKEIIRNLEELKSMNPEINIKDVWKITKSYVFKGKKHSSEIKKLFCLQKTTRFHNEDIENFIEYINLVPDNTELICEYFKDTFERTIDSERMIWLTDEKILDVEKLIMKLGLYHMETVTESDSFFLFEFELSEYFKPTWIDSGFVFYFNSQTENHDHGLTLNLENGLNGAKEFITYRKNVKLNNISLLYPTKTIKAHELSSTFWNNIKSRILQKREEIKC